MAVNLLNSYGFICRSCANILRRPRGESTRVARSWLKRSASTSAVHQQPIRIGIIGSGPAGFYAATRLIEKMPGAMVDMYEQLPVPFGLVRFGVAPDHPEVKNCEERFEQIAKSPRFRFIGNVAVGTDLPLGLLKPNYDALLFAYGASEDKLLGIPGEQVKGVYSARAFVGWYNGLPEHANLKPVLDQGEVATVIGHGNVALDVARILLANVDDLRQTDITEEAIETLSKSRIRKVVTVGRRGPIQAAFTIKEVRELIKLPNTNFVLKDPALLPTKEYISGLPKLEQRRYRLTSLLVDNSAKDLTLQRKAWELWSLRSPLEFERLTGSASSAIGRIKFGINEFVDSNDTFKPTARVQSTSRTDYLSTSLAFRSIGYKSVALPTLESDLGIEFDQKAGIIPNDPYGRVLSPHAGSESDTVGHVAGCYCAGWVKRGPTGVIASTMDDAFSTADAIIKDWESNVPFLNGSSKARTAALRGFEAIESDRPKIPERPVSWQDWGKINAAELEVGKRNGKLREKFRTKQDMLNVLN